MSAMMLLALLAQERFFERSAVDFWDAKRPEPEPTWIEPGHRPPDPVIRLLEAPTRANADAYLRWQEERLAKLQAALQAIADAQAGASDILYFTQPGCGFCAEQDRELEAARIDKRAVRRILPGESPDLWRRYAVRATPTLVVGDRVHRGLARRGEIERMVRP